MNTKYSVLTIVMAAMTLAIAAPAFGAGSSPIKSNTTQRDIAYYNEGVELMLDKRFSKAETQFRKALNKRERFAEAHNNLAYVLRKQGPEHYSEALDHYNRAIELKPGLQEAYMYRGVLHVQMGDMEKARDDHDTLVTMRSGLARELNWVIQNNREKEPEGFFGVTREM